MNKRPASLLALAALLGAGAGCDVASEVIDHLGDHHHPHPVPPPQAAHQELALYLGQASLGIFKTVRHPDGSWDPVPATTSNLGSGGILRTSSVASDAFLFEVDSRSAGTTGGALLEDALPNQGPFTLNTLPRPPLVIPRSFSVADAAGIGGVVHVCGALDGNGGLFHTTRASDGTFAPYDQAPAISLVDASCASTADTLHACAVDDSGAAQHSSRDASGAWQPWQPIPGELGHLRLILCRASGSSLRALAVGDAGAFLGRAGADGSWGPWEHVAQKVQDPRGDQLTQIAIVDGEVHAVGTDADHHLWYTIRHRDGRWDGITDLSQVIAGYPSQPVSVGVAGLDLP
jgi:hypothetical protein